MLTKLRHMADRLFERSSTVLFGYMSKRSRRMVIAVTMLLLATILGLGWSSARQVRDLVIEDFNQQQLILARHAALLVEKSLDNIKREIAVLSRHDSLRTPEPGFLDRQLPLSYSRLIDEGLVEVRYFDSVHDRSYRMTASGYSSTGPDRTDRDLLSETQRTRDVLSLYFASNARSRAEDALSRSLLYVVKPIQQTQGPRSGAGPRVFTKGALIFIVDITTVAERVLKDLRSGKSGYAWMIDNNGTFLYHPEHSFIGKNAFEARKERRPTISFLRINEIQQQRMLKGEEGTSWYLSGWHRGAEGSVGKLIAFSPIVVAEGPERIIWSVAVVAPMAEIEGAIEAIQFRQYLLEGVIIIVVLLGSFMAFSLMARWSSTLKTEVSKKTAELLKSENRYRSLVENANDIIFTVDRDSVITSMNRAGCQFFGRPQEDLIGQNIGAICHNESSATLQFKAIDEVFSTGESRQIVHVPLMRGAEHWLSTNFSMLKDEHGRPSAVLGISRDITADKHKERAEQMYHTEKLASMGTLAAGVAHEINNPLGLILGFSDLLLERNRPDTEEYDMLKTIEKHGLNAKRVVENLLSFARYSDHAEEIVDVNRNVESILNVVKNTLLLNRIKLAERFSDDLPQVKGDPGELQQVFLNIINNAIHAMRGGGTLTVATRHDERNGRVEIRFSDTGQGIRKEHRGRIFDPLFTTKKVGEGTGLGLSVSYGIVTKYGGTITFESKTADESERPGTTFLIALQAAKD